MRRYEESVEVRRGPVPGWPGEGPAQFLWRGRLWKVRAVVDHWVETGPWWQHAGLRAAIGTDEHPGPGRGPAATSRTGTLVEDLLDERELWRVEAGPGASGDHGPGARGAGGTFELAHQHAHDHWQLVGCTD